MLSQSAYASPGLTTEQLLGKWLIIMAGDINTRELDLGDDYWIFTKNQFQVESSGRSFKPDPYKIDGSNIIYGTKPYEVVLEVISITETELKIKFSGAIHLLEKVN